MVGFQRLAYGTDAAIHHVAGGHDVSPGFGLRQSLLDQYLHRGIVHDVAVFLWARVRQTVLPVTGEGVECDIGHDAELRKFFFQASNHARYQAIRVEGFATIRGFQTGINHRKQRHHRNALLDAILFHRQQQCPTPL